MNEHKHTPFIAELRAELASAKTRLCTHGVPRTNCNEHHNNDDPPQTPPQT